MSDARPSTPRLIGWSALVFAMLTFTVSWWHWWTFQYGTFDLSFYVQALWLALRGKWMVSLLNVPLMGNHAEPIVFLLTPVFALWPHPMMFVVVQTLALASMPFTAWRIGKRLELEPTAAALMALATILTPATFSIGIYEFHPEALAAPLILLLIEARLAEKRGLFWLWFIAVLGVKENMAPLLIMFCGVFAVMERKRDRAWHLAWNLLPLGVAAAWLLVYGKIISPALNAGNVDYLQLYGHLGSSPSDIVTKFFTEPQRVLGALRTSLTQGNMLWALLLPLLALPLLRPRWLIIGAPLFLQHLLSYRYTEWSLGAHYPAPFLPLFWIAAAEALRRWRAQTLIAAAVVAACVLAHLRFGAAREVAAEIPSLNIVLEDREWKAAMIADIPAAASVTASLGFLPHLAAREKLISLHHILKGLKTLSVAAYTPPPPGDFVVIDYADTLTFSTAAGYYHPWSRVDATHMIASSDRLLHDYLVQARWRAESKNAVTVLRRGEPLPPFGSTGTVVHLDGESALTGIQLVQHVPGGMQVRMALDITGERWRFPWLMLVLSDGHHLFPLLKGPCAIEADQGKCYEDWTVLFPMWIPAGSYTAFAQFYDHNEAAWRHKMPPDDPAYTLSVMNLGPLEIKPGDFTPTPAK